MQILSLEKRETRKSGLQQIIYFPEILIKKNLLVEGDRTMNVIDC